jgi:bifunctional protein TilS/HprT
MAASDLRAFYKAMRRGAALLSSSTDLKSTLNGLVRETSRAMEAGASILLLDTTGNKLAHRFTWGLPKGYVQKDILDARKSLAEVFSRQPVVVRDVKRDSRLQYPELATRAGIVSILGVPVLIDGVASGSLRIYSPQHRDFSQMDTGFVHAVADLVAAAIQQDRLRLQKVTVPLPERQPTAPLFSRADTVEFVHPSEQEFARWLDFYRVEWLYEPRSFPLSWKEEKVTEMFTPDFYLPGLDLYVELTTMKQRLVTEKNRKLRRLRELYPEVKITLLYKKDFEELLGKYGYGPLSQSRGQGIHKVLYSEVEIQRRIKELAKIISEDYANRHPILVGVLRGVFCFMADLVRQISIPLEIEFMAVSYYGSGSSPAVKITKDLDLDIAGRHVIMVEDIVDTGMTLNYLMNHLKAKGPASLTVCALLDKRVRRIVNVPIDYIGFEVADKFVVGYGLDYLGSYRNLPFLEVLETRESLLAEDFTVEKKT